MTAATQISGMTHTAGTSTDCVSVLLECTKSFLIVITTSLLSVRTAHPHFKTTSRFYKWCCACLCIALCRDKGHMESLTFYNWVCFPCGHGSLMKSMHARNKNRRPVLNTPLIRQEMLLEQRTLEEHCSSISG